MGPCPPYLSQSQLHCGHVLAANLDMCLGLQLGHAHGVVLVEEGTCGTSSCLLSSVMIKPGVFCFFAFSCHLYLGASYKPRPISGFAVGTCLWCGPG